MASYQEMLARYMELRRQGYSGQRLAKVVFVVRSRHAQNKMQGRVKWRDLDK
jgi:hypothetical protein